MSLAIYNFFTFLFRIAFSFVAIWNEKARKGLQGRTKQKAQLKAGIQQKSIWMHCASLGEFEQGRPIDEALKLKYPSKKVIISFFSASGFEAAKNYQWADEVLYLPFDGKKSSNKFIDLVNPEIVIWVKYEYWYWYLTNLKQRQVPILLVSAHFRSAQPFFKWYGGLYRKMLHNFKKIFIQNEESITLIKNILPEGNFSMTGDTRFDRVVELKNNFEPLPVFIQDFVTDFFCVVVGSSWPEDELQLMHFAKTNNHVKFFIVPHEVDKESINEVKGRFPSHVLYSDLINKSATINQANVMIVDVIGVLSRLYKYADIAYIGGGFNESGIHNTLEAAVWGNAIVFGPVFDKFVEAVTLLDIGVANSISTPVELEAVLNDLLSNKELLEKKKTLSENFVKHNQGATARIVNYIQENRLLIN